VFTLLDNGAGQVIANVENLLSEAVSVFLNWSWGGVNGLSSHIIGRGRMFNLQVNLPPGFDASLEIGANRV
jgi:hypothetical protein